MSTRCARSTQSRRSSTDGTRISTRSPAISVADIRAVGNVWNDWKGQLLRDLYRLTEAALHGGRSDEEGVRAHLAEIAGAAKEQLLKDIGGARADVLQAWLDALDDGYWLNHDADALKWHALEVMRAPELSTAREPTHPHPRYVTRVPHPRFDYEFALLPSQKYILQKSHFSNHIIALQKFSTKIEHPS